MNRLVLFFLLLSGFRLSAQSLDEFFDRIYLQEQSLMSGDLEYIYTGNDALSGDTTTKTYRVRLRFYKDPVKGEMLFLITNGDTVHAGIGSNLVRIIGGVKERNSYEWAMLYAERLVPPIGVKLAPAEWKDPAVSFLLNHREYLTLKGNVMEGEYTSIPKDPAFAAYITRCYVRFRCNEKGFIESWDMKRNFFVQERFSQSTFTIIHSEFNRVNYHLLKTEIETAMQNARIDSSDLPLWYSRDLTAPEKGGRLADFELKDEGGLRSSLHKKAGQKPLLLVFWIYNSEPCRRLLTMMDSLAGPISEKGIKVVSINPPFVHKGSGDSEDFTPTNVSVYACNREVCRQMGVNSFPTLILVSPDFQVLDVIGIIDDPNELMRRLDEGKCFTPAPGR